MILEQCRALAGYFVIFVLVISAAGCGGGGDSGSGTPGGNLPITVNPAYLDVYAGNISTIPVGGTITLSNLTTGVRASNSLGSPMTYAWSFTAKPAGSTAELQNATTLEPSFTADVLGTYIVQLLVTAGDVSSRAVTTIIAATPGDSSPTGPYNHPGLNSNCGICHNGNVDVGKSEDHIATSSACQACHTTLSFTEILFVDHLEVVGNCSSCHDGITAITKSSSHLETELECNSSGCHNTTSFLELEPDGSFDHSTINRGCTSCHNGIVATGKDEGHMITESECNACHTVNAFLPASGFDHEGIINDCSRSGCHGDGATGKTAAIPTHIVTTLDCSVCHNILGFALDAGFDHSAVSAAEQACGSCHNDVNAIGKDEKLVRTGEAHLQTNADCGNCHNTEGFTPSFVDHTSTEVTSRLCADCHNDTDAPGMSVNHIDIGTQDCDVCHAPGTFTSNTYDHSGADLNNCASCHNHEISVGKPGNHVETVEDCSICHSTVNFDTFAGAVFNHTGITSDCASCHDGNIATGKKVNHIPTVDDCSVCHHDTTDFATTIFFGNVHSSYTDNCSTCHDGVTAVGKTSNHIPAQDDCSVCHNSTDIADPNNPTDGFLPNVFLATVHPGLTGGCGGCHETPFLGSGLIKGATHVPTAQDCRFCHTNDTGGFTAANNFDHSGITGNCESCHDGSFTAIGARGKADDPTPPHPDTTEDCGACHNTTNFADAFVDHTSPEVLNARCDSCHGVTATGKNQGHVPTNEDCRVCHVPGTFATAVFNHQGIVDNCVACHDGNTATATVKPNDHLPTNEDCSVCHNTTAFAGARFDHQGITNNCASCHDGTTATGKSGNHVPTTDDCSECHVTTGFTPATFNHRGIVDNCQSCHDGAFATGKPRDHVPTNADCGACHNTTAFIPATFNHEGIVGNCASCHNGNDATGKPGNHLPTNLDCSNCHTTATFVGGTWDHSNVAPGTCGDCHDGNTATGKPNGHFSTNLVCDACHSTNSWGVNYTHARNTDYPGDHRANLGCTRCHTDNDQNISYRWPQYAGTCASCHAGDFDAGEHRGGLSNNLNCGDSGCHRVSDRNWD